MHSRQYKTTANLMLMFSPETFITAKYNTANYKLVQNFLKSKKEINIEKQNNYKLYI